MKHEPAKGNSDAQQRLVRAYESDGSAGEQGGDPGEDDPAM